ncbi:hypothetical protein FRB99_005583 [Tulasnella sp. 403]|nr:hypothetical protein FRB99_005583 [Tulasnella sp. 403]
MLCLNIWLAVSALDEEINYIWLRKRSFSKFLYFVTRYFGLSLLAFEMMSETRGWAIEFCESYYYVVGIATTLLLYIVEIGMQFRVYALYDCSKKILVVNAVLFLTEVIAISTMLGLDLYLRARPIATPDFNDQLPLTGCWNLERPHFTFVNWIIALAYELYLFVLICYKAYGKYSQYGTFIGIFKLMFRDAVAWFVFIAGLICWNAFSWFGGSRGNVFLGLPFLHAGAAIGGSRLLLNIGKAYYFVKDESIVCMGVSGSMINSRSRQAHELQTMGGTSLRTYPSNSSAALASSSRRMSHPPRVMNCKAFSSRHPPGWNRLSSTSNLTHQKQKSLPTAEDNNALQIDLGDCAEEDNSEAWQHTTNRPPATSYYYSYSEAWVEQNTSADLWDEVHLDDRERFDVRTSGRESTGSGVREWRYRRSQSTSRPPSPRSHFRI